MLKVIVKDNAVSIEKDIKDRNVFCREATAIIGALYKNVHDWSGPEKAEHMMEEAKVSIYALIPNIPSIPVGDDNNEQLPESIIKPEPRAIRGALAERELQVSWLTDEINRRGFHICRSDVSKALHETGYKKKSKDVLKMAERIIEEYDRRNI